MKQSWKSNAPAERSRVNWESEAIGDIRFTSGSLLPGQDGGPAAQIVGQDYSRRFLVVFNISAPVVHIGATQNTNELNGFPLPYGRRLLTSTNQELFAYSPSVTFNFLWWMAESV